MKEKRILKENQKTISLNNKDHDLVNRSNIFDYSLLTLNKEKTGKKYSFLSLFFGFLLFFIAIILAERLLFDINRLANPLVVSTSFEESENSDNLRSHFRNYRNYFDLGSQQSDKVIFGKNKVFYQKVNEKKYLRYKIFIYSAIILPFFIFSLVLFFLKKEKIEFKPILTSLLAAGFWLFFHLICLIYYFLMSAYKNVGTYIILITSALIVVVLTYYSQVYFLKKTGKK